MLSHLARLAVCIVFVGSVTLPAEGQPRRSGSGSRSPSRRDLNPVHERTKTEAQQAYQRGDYQRTIDLTTSVLRSNPRDDVAYYLRASARVELGLQQRDGKLVRNGIADSREAIRINGLGNPIYYVPYLYGMTGLAKVENRPEHAEIAEKFAGVAMGQSGVSDEDKAHLLYQRARCRVVLGKLDEAISDFEQAARQAPDQLGFQLDLADAYAKAGRTDEAAAAFDRAARRFPDQAVVFNNRGMFHHRQGNSQQAIGDYTRAIELSPQYFYAYTNRGFTLLDSGEPEAAEADFTASLRINSNQPSVYGLRATARLQQGKIDQAITDHRTAVRLSPENAVAHADLGHTLFFNGNYQQAVQEFNKAVQLDPSRKYLSPWRYLAMVRAGQQEAAREQFSPQIEPEASQRVWIDHLLSYLAGEIDDDQLLQSVNREKPAVEKAQLCEAHFFIGQKKDLAGDTKAAQEHFQQAVGTGAKQLAAYRGAQVALNNLAAVQNGGAAPPGN